MKRRWAVALATGAIGLVGLAGCGASSPDAGGPALGGTAEDQAIQALGISDTGQPQAEPAGAGESAAPKQKGHRHPRLRRYVMRHTLHGDVTVKTKNGTATVAVQRGTVQSVTATSVTVKSSDGFTETWTLTGDTKVRADKKAADRSAVTKGEEIGIAGRQQGKTDTARLVVVIKK